MKVLLNKMGRFLDFQKTVTLAKILNKLFRMGQPIPKTTFSSNIILRKNFRRNLSYISSVNVTYTKFLITFFQKWNFNNRNFTTNQHQKLIHLLQQMVRQYLKNNFHPTQNIFFRSIGTGWKTILILVESLYLMNLL